ncbi:YfbM family protein [Streptomyces sp. SKN60]|nr:YfbM family protein [Streptomyces sp. SKN60]
MGAAWDVIEVEHAAGVADAIEKDYGRLDELYRTETGTETGTGTGTEPAASDAELPVFGGRQPAGAPTDRYPDPPLILLEPAGVARAAAFLATVSFDALWARLGGRIVSSMGPDWDDATVREMYETHHRSLRGFYERAAAAGHAVIKAGWF